MERACRSPTSVQGQHLRRPAPSTEQREAAAERAAARSYGAMHEHGGLGGRRAWAGAARQAGARAGRGRAQEAQADRGGARQPHLHQLCRVGICPRLCPLGLVQIGTAATRTGPTARHARLVGLSGRLQVLFCAAAQGCCWRVSHRFEVLKMHCTSWRAHWRSRVCHSALLCLDNARASAMRECKWAVRSSGAAVLLGSRTCHARGMLPLSSLRPPIRTVREVETVVKTVGWSCIVGIAAKQVHAPPAVPDPASATHTECLRSLTRRVAARRAQTLCTWQHMRLPNPGACMRAEQHAWARISWT